MYTDYHKLDIIDLAINEAFIKHYLLPTSESTQFWNHWREQSEINQENWHLARNLIEAVQLGLSDYTRTYLSKEAEEDLLNRILITNHASHSLQNSNPFTRQTGLRKMLAASVVLAFLGMAYWIFTQRPFDTSIYLQQLSIRNEKMIEQKNDLTEPFTFYLPDSSAITLFPGSKLSYDMNFGNAHRDVYLSGKATFAVVKNPEKPFLVFSNEIITKVLGTQFEVSAFDKDQNVIVKVQSGQVSVYQDKGNTVKDQIYSEKSGVLLMPNQQVTYKRAGEQFNKTLVDDPLLLSSNPNNPSQFIFEEIPITEVLLQVGTAYGVDLIYSHEILNGCELTANLSEVPLYGKLDIICRSIGATYEIVDGQIIVISKGCKK